MRRIFLSTSVPRIAPGCVRRILLILFGVLLSCECWSAELTPASAESRKFSLAATADYTWFGGTHWNAAASRWEANMSSSRENAWTFDSGVDGNREGWTGVDLSIIPPPTLPAGNPDNADFRWTSDAIYAVYGTPGTDLFPGTGDDGAIWCSKYEGEADELCWQGGQGYGNNWRHEARKVFPYGGTGGVRLTYRYFQSSEASFDFTFLYLEFNGVRESLTRATLTYNIGRPTSKATKTLTISASTIPAGTTAIAAVFNFTSDSGWSDQDGDWPTSYGGFCCYNFNYEDLGTPANNDEDTFEAGPEGWTFQQKIPIGNLMDITPLADLPPPAGGCEALSGNVLTLYDKSGEPFHPVQQWTRALSPRIDLAAAGLSTAPVKFVVADAFMDLPVDNHTYCRMSLRYPSICPVTGLPIEKDVTFGVYGGAFDDGPECFDEHLFANFSSLPDTIEYCYIALDVFEDCHYGYSCPGGSTTPWYDNVRFGVGQTAVGIDPASGRAPGVPQLTVQPNPFNRAVTLEYTIATPGSVTLRLYDTRGRLVRTLVEASLAAGEHRAIWDGLDDGGSEVAAGVFWATCQAGGQESRRKIVFLK